MDKIRVIQQIQEHGVVAVLRETLRMKWWRWRDKPSRAASALSR